VTLGDSWLGPAIRGGLIQPIPDAESSRWWVSCSLAHSLRHTTSPPLGILQDRPLLATSVSCLSGSSGSNRGVVVHLQGSLPPRWQELVKRGRDGAADPNGAVFACPHRWGCTLIAYRKNALLRHAPADLLPACLTLSPCACPRFWPLAWPCNYAWEFTHIYSHA
jgi:hypothetical protein